MQFLKNNMDIIHRKEHVRTIPKDPRRVNSCTFGMCLPQPIVNKMAGSADRLKDFSLFFLQLQI